MKEDEYWATILNDADQFDERRPHGEWIPCSERLPRYNEYVLVYRPEMAIKIIVDCYDDGWSYSKNDAVVAWMPLPEPYKEVGEQNGN